MFIGNEMNLFLSTGTKEFRDSVERREHGSGKMISSSSRNLQV